MLSSRPGQMETLGNIKEELVRLRAFEIKDCACECRISVGSICPFSGQNLQTWHLFFKASEALEMSTFEITQILEIFCSCNKS